METERIVENPVRRVRPSLLVGLAVGSMALSGAFALGGKVKIARLIGQWVPSLLILATFDRLMEGGAGRRPSSNALPNGVVGSSPGTGIGSSLGGTADSNRTPGL